MSNKRKTIVLAMSCLVAALTFSSNAVASTSARDARPVGTDQPSRSEASDAHERELVAAAGERCSSLSNRVPTTFMGAGRMIGVPVSVGTSARARCVRKRLRVARRIGATRPSLGRNEDPYRSNAAEAFAGEATLCVGQRHTWEGRHGTSVGVFDEACE
jgi:hypothetical protein